MGELAGRTVLVTGAASGIGRCLALEFAREGCELVLVDIQAAGLEGTAAEVLALGRGASCHTVDITDVERVEALAGEVSPDVLVNCAGLSVTADLEDTTPAEWRLTMDVNFFGTVSMVKAFLPGLKRKGGSRIVNIASAFGLFSFPGMGAYCASKFAVVAYTKALAGEVSRHGVRVTLICPGITRTHFLDNTIMDGYEGDKEKVGLRRLLPLISADPERLARFIVKAVKRNRGMVVHTWIAKLVYCAGRVSPAATDACLRLGYRIAFIMRAREAGASVNTAKQ